MSFSIEKTLESIAPALTTMLAGPLAGTAVTAIEGALGMTSKAGATVDDRIKAVGDAIQAGALTPDAIVKLRVANQHHAEVIEADKIDVAKINADHQAAMTQADAGDRASARQRQVALKDRTPAHLAYIIIIGFFVLVAVELMMVFTGHLAAVGREGAMLIGTLTAYLAHEAKAAAAFFFGVFRDKTSTPDTAAKPSAPA